MRNLAEIVVEKTALNDEDRVWLSAFVNHWDVLADTSFSDLVLWAPDKNDPNVFWALAQIRPNTSSTAIEEDVVGQDLAYDPEHVVTVAYYSGEITEASQHSMDVLIPVDIAAIPITKNGEVIAVVERDTNQMGVRSPGALEDNYLEISRILSQMLAQGSFPVEPLGDSLRTPTVGDGLVRVEPNGIVSYANPNAVSAWRRLGIHDDLAGDRISDLVGSLDNLTTDMTQVSLEEASEFNLETENSALRVRVIPIQLDEVSHGCVILSRDITQLRERDRQLVNKDVLIREIHHRIKNNLQTVAALLRLQARRTKSEDAKDSLRDAMRRVQSIATVHEILSQSFDEVVAFDEIADRILTMVGDVAASSGCVNAHRKGSFGMIDGDAATSLCLAITELCQNAIEHGLGSGSGELLVIPKYLDSSLIVDVVDNGIGIAEDFDMTNTNSLGLSIVGTLAQDLGGKFSLTNNDESSPFSSGSTARIVVPLTVLTSPSNRQEG